MCELDEILEHVRSSARSRAIEEIEAMERSARIAASYRVSISATFSESDKRRYIKECEDEAVSRLKSNLYGLALKPAETRVNMTITHGVCKYSDAH